jgi:hypothetical protein
MSEDKPSGQDNRLRRRAEQERAQREDQERKGGRTPFAPAPVDALERQLWAQGVACSYLEEVNDDRVLSTNDRRKQAATFLQVIAKLAPGAIKEQAVADFRAKYEKKPDPKSANDPKRAGSKIEPYQPAKPKDEP